jgi:hypothetical protein
VGIFGGNSEVRVDVCPRVASPRQTVRADVRIGRPVTGVVSAVLEWGYTNFYRYQWTPDRAEPPPEDSGETGAALRATERESEDWVGITRVELPVEGGEFRGGTATFRVPSWAPGSSGLIARWSCRLVMQRTGSGVYARGDFDVAIGSADVRPPDGPVERLDFTCDTAIDIELTSLVYRAGETLNGQIALTPHADLPDGEATVHLQRLRASHPLTRTRAAADVVDTATQKFEGPIALCAGLPVVLPFTLRVPEDAPPTAAALHSSLSWFVAGEMRYVDDGRSTVHRVRRKVVVINAP